MLNQISKLLMFVSCITSTLGALGQTTKNRRLDNSLIYHQTFDNSTNARVNFNTISFNDEANVSATYIKSFLPYSGDMAINCGCDSKNFLSFRDISGSDLIGTFVFWFKIISLADNQCDSQKGRHNFTILLTNNDSLRLQTDETKQNFSINFIDLRDTNHINRIKLCDLTLDTWYLLTITSNQNASANQDKSQLYTLSIQKLAEINSKPSLTQIQIVNWDKVSSVVLSSLLKDSTRKNISVSFHSALATSIYVNDFRVYQRSLDVNDFKSLLTYNINKNSEIFKYELAYTCKKLADEYFIHNNIDSATKYYSFAKGLVDTTKKNSIDPSELEDINPLYSTYFKLLDKDINYRQALIEQGYSFWGREFSTNPLFPVAEYSNFKDVYTHFKDIYDNIEDQIKDKKAIDEKVLKENIKSLSRIYENQILQTKNEEAAYNVDFYDDQIKAINERLSDIEFTQKKINADVQRWNSELTANEKKLTSIVSQAVTQSVTGVSIDVTQPLSQNFRNVGFALINSNPEIKETLLGSQNDFINLTNVSLDYYNKAKDGVKAIQQIASGDISPEKLISLGDALTETVLSNPQYQQEWENLKNQYSDINSNLAKYKEFKKQAQDIFQKAKNLVNPNLQNLSDFVDWLVQSGNVPELADYQNLYQNIYQDIRNKKYESLLLLGRKILDSISTSQNPTIKRISQSFSEIQKEYSYLKPMSSIFERIPKDKAISEVLGRILITKIATDAFYDYDIQDFVLRNMQRFLSNSNDMQNKVLLINRMLISAPEVFLQFLSPDAIQALKINNGLENTNDLAIFLGKCKLTFNKSDTSIVFQASDQVILRLYRESFIIGSKKFPVYWSFNTDNSKQYLNSLFKLMQNVSVRNALVGEIPIAEWYNIFDNSKIEIKDQKVFFDKVISELKSSHNSATIDSIYNDGLKVFIGSKMLANYTEVNQDQIAKELPALSETNMYTRKTDVGNGGDVTKQLATSALTMAFPAAGLAFNTLSSIVGNILDSYDLIDQLKEAYTQKQQLYNEYINKLDQLRTTMRDKKIAYFEKDIAKLNLELAEKQKNEFDKMEFDFIANEQLRVRGKIANLLPIFYYYAERLRYYYNRLNKASTFWYGKENTLSDIVQNDEGNLRLALDQSINLFDWVNQPDVTSTRQDIDSIMSFWRKQYTLVTEPTNATKLEFGTGGVNIQFFYLNKQNDEFRTQWSAFKSWQQNLSLPDVKPFTFVVDVPKLLQSSYMNLQQTSGKIIDVALEGIDKNQSPVNSISNLLKISHPGVSVSEDGEIQILEKKELTSSDLSSLNIDKYGKVVPDRNYQQTLKDRWIANGNIYRPRYFEGYNLNSPWYINVLPSQDAANIDNIYFFLSYQYTINPKKKEITETIYKYRIVVKTNDNKTQIFYENYSEEAANHLLNSLNAAKNNHAIKDAYVEKVKGQNNVYEAITSN